MIAFFAAPLIFGVYTLNPNEAVDEELFREVGVALTRIFLIQIFFYGATGVANALLQSRKRFFAAAWSPIVANIVIIISLLSIPRAGEQEYGLEDVLTNDRLRWTLGLGATLGIVAMAMVLVPAIRRAGIRLRRRLDLRHPAVRRVLVLSGWTIGYVAANQISVIVVRNLADPGSGDAAAYFDAFTFFIFPYGLLGVSIATTFVPDLARSVVRRDKPSFMRAVVARPAHDGAADAAGRRAAASCCGARSSAPSCSTASTSRPTPLDTANALGGFALGLVGLSVYVFALRGFYAHQDTRTPFVINVVENMLNIVLAVVAGRPLRRARAGPGVRPRVPHLVGVGDPGALVQGARVPDRRGVRQLLADDRGRRARPARWPGSSPGSSVGGDVGTAALVRVIVGRRRRRRTSAYCCPACP